MALLTPDEIDSLLATAMKAPATPAPDQSRSLAGKILAPDQIDNLLSSAMTQPPITQPTARLKTPEELAAEPAPMAAPSVAQHIQQTGEQALRSMPPNRLTTGVPDPGDLAELPVGPSRTILEIGRMGGRARGLAGKVTEATAADIVEAPAALAGYQPVARNLRAYASSTRPLAQIQGAQWNPDTQKYEAPAPMQPLPRELDVEKMHGLERFLNKAVLSLAEMEPRLAASFAMGGAGAPAALSAALPMLVTDKGEYDPIGAAIAAGLPGVSRIGEEAVANVIAKAPVSKIIVEVLGQDPLKLKGKIIQELGGMTISNDQFRKFLEAGGGMMAANAYLGITQAARNAPELAQMSGEQRRQWAVDMVAQNIAPALLGFLRPGMSRSLAMKGEEIAPDFANLVAELKAAGAQKPPPPAVPPSQQIAPETGPTPPPVAPITPTPNANPIQGAVAPVRSEQPGAAPQVAAGIPGQIQQPAGTPPPQGQVPGAVPATPGSVPAPVAAPVSPPPVIPSPAPSALTPTSAATVQPPTAAPASTPAETPARLPSIKELIDIPPHELSALLKSINYGPDTPKQIAAGATLEDLPELVAARNNYRVAASRSNWEYEQMARLLQAPGTTDVGKAQIHQKLAGIMAQGQTYNLKAQTLNEIAQSIPDVAAKIQGMTDNAQIEATVDGLAKPAAPPTGTVEPKPGTAPVKAGTIPPKPGTDQGNKPRGASLRPKVAQPKAPNETPRGPTVEPSARPPGTPVAGQTPSAPKPGQTQAAPGPSGGTDVAPGSPTTPTGNAGGGRAPSGGPPIPRPGKPAVRPGQPPAAAPTSPPAAPGVPPAVGPTPKPAPAKPKSSDPNAANHVIGPNDEIAPKGRVGKLTANINAIQILKKLEAENRNATPDEKAQLAKYTGWGALSQAFDSEKGKQMENAEENRYSWNRDEKWEKEWGKWYKQLKALLTDEEWRAAARSSQYAHFTSKTVISNMWDVALRMGFTGGTVVERAAGVGHFFGLAPEAIRDSNFVGIERDPLSARIMAKLYPEAKIFNKDTAEVKIPPGSVDLEITNVPFSSNTVDDPRYPVKLNLHNWFIAKMLDDVKPGGLVITVTSGHTMDSQATMRHYLAGRAELIGALRLPNTAFKENAGTEVTTDILILRKPMTPTPQAGQPWSNLKEIKTHDDKPVMVNEYFADHPEMILGLPSIEGTMHAGREEYATLPFKDKSLEDAFKEAIAKLPKDVFEKEPAQMVDFGALGEAGELKENTMVEREGALTVAQGGRFVDPKQLAPEMAKPEKVRQAKAYVGLRDSYVKLRDLQLSEDSTNAEIESARSELNKLYDGYVKKYGNVQGRNSDYLDFEHDYPLVAGLEREIIKIDPDTEKVSKTYGKADVLLKRTQFPVLEPETAGSLQDALQIALSWKGTVDVPYIARLMSMSPDVAERELLDAGAVFRNPESLLLETPEQYLSGNVRTKLERAKLSAGDDAAYGRNVDALEKVQPETKPFRKIRVMLGATWVPADVVTEFARGLFGSRTGGVSYNHTSDSWIVGGFQQTPEVSQTYGTNRKDGEDILNSMLNQKTIKIYDTFTDLTDPDGTEHRVFNPVDTQKVRDRADKIEAAFQTFLKSRGDIQARVEEAYNTTANNTALRTYDIARLDLPGASSDIVLRANQRNAIWRFVQERRGVGAETAGAGKTFIQIATAMECKRLGLAKKPMIAVMNSTLAQFANAFRTLYPSANVLVASRDDLTPDRRKAFLSKIAANDWDSIIIPHSQFNMLPDDPAWEEQMINQLLDELQQAIIDATASMSGQQAKKDPTVKQLQKQLEKYQDKLNKLADRKKEDLINFQDLGVDMLLIDEAHTFKKPPFITKRDNIAGLNKQMSEIANSLYMKARYIQSRNNGRGVIGFTGTPVTNTLGEVWHMLNLFSPEVLKDFGVDTFDRFLSTFARVKSDFDVNPVGTLVLKDKLSRFVNGSELKKLIRSAWDVVTGDDLRTILESAEEARAKAAGEKPKLIYPKLEGGEVHNIAVPRTPQVEKFMGFLGEVYDAYNALQGKDKRLWNFIPVLTFLAGKAAALDARLVDPTAADHPGSKINVALKDIFKRWQDTAGKRLTQAVFLDQMNPFTGGVAQLRHFASHQNVEFEAAGEKEAEPTDDLFLFKDMKRKLVAMGMPEKEILIINEHDTQKPQAALLFDKINNGEVRIVIGSTAKMGVGVNMQKRLYGLTHLDVPWFPALLEQRNGRIMRPGNSNPEVWIGYYGVEKTSEVGLYGKNESKAKFCEQAIAGNIDAEEFDDPAGPLILSMAEQMAALSGDPLLFEKVQLENRIRTLRMQSEAFVDDQVQKERSKRGLQGSMQIWSNDAAQMSAAIDPLESQLQPIMQKEPVFDATIAGRKYTEQKELVAAIDAVLTQHLAKIKRGLDTGFYNWGKRAFDLMADDRVDIGTVNGVELSGLFYADKSLQKDDKGNTQVINNVQVARVAGAPKDKPAVYLLHGFPKTGTGTIQAMKEIVPRGRAYVAEKLKEVEKAKAEVAEIDRLLEMQFTGAEELSKAERRYGELRDQVFSATNPQGQKAADLLFEVGIDKAPLLIRLRSAIKGISEQLEAKQTEVTRMEFRLNMEEKSKGLTVQQRQKHPEQQKINEMDGEIVAMKERVAQLTKRLAIVEKARMESEKSGDAWLLPYGVTPSTRPGVSYNIEDPQALETTAADEVQAQGIEELRTILSDPNSGLSPDARRVALDLLDEPVMRGLDWSGLTVAIKDKLAGGASGAATVADSLLELARGASPTTFPHEVFHFLYELLPAADKERLEELRQDAVDAEVENFPGGASPGALDVLDRLRDGPMTSQEFADMLAHAADVSPDAAAWLRGIYDLINPSEMLAGIGGRGYSEKSWNQRNDGWFDGFVNRVKAWLRGLLDALKRLFHMKPDIQQIIRELLAGKYRNQPEGGVEMERRMSGETPSEPSGQEAEKPAVEPLTLADVELQGEIATSVANDGTPIKTQRMGTIDTILGREMMDPAFHMRGKAYAAAVLAKSGLQVQEAPDGYFELLDADFESEIEGHRLLEQVKADISKQQTPGTGQTTGELGYLINSIRLHMTDDSVGAFSLPLKTELYAVTQGEASHRGLMLGALAALPKTTQYAAQNVNTLLARTYSDAFGGDFVRKITARIITAFRAYFTEAEVDRALAGHPELQDVLDKALALNRRDDGGRVYRKAQALLKPKAAKKLGALEADARVEEAVEEILQQLKKEGIEPKPSPNKKLPAIERLLLMTEPKTAAKIDKAIANAVANAEHNAGIKYALSKAATKEDLEDLQARFEAGEEPSEEDVEAGLSLPQFVHWKVLRDNLLGYNPVTIKLVQDLIRSDFKGTRFAPPQEKLADTRIDLEKLAKAPEDEVKRVFDAYLQNVSASINIANGNPDTKQRVLGIVEDQVTQQLEKARARAREPMFQAPKDPKTPLTPEQRIGGLINAGLFGDPRLDVGAMVARVAAKSAVQRLTPKVADLVRQALQTPFWKQSGLAENFARLLTEKLGISVEQAVPAMDVFHKAFDDKFKLAKEQAAKQALESLTPQERRQAKPGKPLWQKIVQNVNAGNFDSATILAGIAQAHGWNPPSEAEVSHIKTLAERLQRLQQLTPAERTEAGDDSEKLRRAQVTRDAVTIEKRAVLAKEISARWAALTKPISWMHPIATRQNIASAINEFEVGNMLLKVGFAFRLPIHILTQLMVHIPTRAVGEAVLRHQGGDPTPLWKDVGQALKDGFGRAATSIRPALRSAEAALMGRGEARNVDRLNSGIMAFERMGMKADELAAAGKHAQAFAMRFLALARFSLRFVQAVDNFQGLPAEYGEIAHQIEGGLRERGMTEPEILANKDKVLGRLKEKRDLAMAQAALAFQQSGVDYTPGELAESAWNLVRSQIYEDMRALGLPADDFRARNEKLRRVIAWQERTVTGPGGLMTAVGKKASELFAWAGLPLSFTRFANAVGTGINYSLMFTPLYKLADARAPHAEHSPWFETEQDRMQRRVQAVFGSLVGALIIGLILKGLMRVMLAGPKDKKERDLWTAQGHRPYTLEIRVGDNEFIPLSLAVGPASIISPYAAAAGAVFNLIESREKAQAKLDEEALRTGLPAGKVRQLDTVDYLAVAGQAAWGSLMANKAFSGVSQSMSEFGIPSTVKTAAAYVSPAILGLPAYQEFSRAMGVNMDIKMASFWDWLVPLPSSHARAYNVLGDPVKTPDDIQRIIQTITAGSYPGIVDESANRLSSAYAALMNSGYHPPDIAVGQGHAIDGQWRPLTNDEIERYGQTRGNLFKDALSALGPTADVQMVRRAFEQADSQALQSVGVDTNVKPLSATSPSGSTIPQGSATRYVPGLPALAPAAAMPGAGTRQSGMGMRRLSAARGLRRPAGVPRSIRGLSRGPSMRPRGAGTFRVPTGRRGAGVPGVRSLRPAKR